VSRQSIAGKGRAAIESRKLNVKLERSEVRYSELGLDHIFCEKWNENTGSLNYFWYQPVTEMFLQLS